MFLGSPNPSLLGMEHSLWLPSTTQSGNTYFFLSLISLFGQIQSISMYTELGHFQGLVRTYLKGSTLCTFHFGFLWLSSCSSTLSLPLLGRFVLQSLSIIIPNNWHKCLFTPIIWISISPLKILADECPPFLRSIGRTSRQ